MKTKRLSLFAAVLSVLSPSLSAQANDLDPSRVRMAESATDKGNAFLKKEKYERAEGEFERALEHEKRYPSAYLGLGAVQVATGRHEAALQSLYEAERRFADWQRINEVAGLQNRQHFANREREMRDFARITQQNNPAAPGGSGEPGGGSVGAGSVARDVAMDRHIADRIQPEDVAGIPAQVFYLEGVALLRLGRRHEGVDALQTALFVEPDHALAYYNLAVASFTGGELEAAGEYLSAAIDNGAEPHPQFVSDLNSALEEAGLEVVGSR